MHHIEVNPEKVTPSVVARVADTVFVCAACAMFACLIYVFSFYYSTGTRGFDSAVAGGALIFGLAAATGLLGPV
jgi:hypothetical protein